MLERASFRPDKEAKREGIRKGELGAETPFRNRKAGKGDAPLPLQGGKRGKKRTLGLSMRMRKRRFQKEETTPRKKKTGRLK